MTLRPKFRLLILLLGLTCTVGCDQTTKHLARAKLGSLGAVMLPGGFGELRLAENPGSFLSFGASFPASLRSGIFIVGVGLSLVMLFIYLARSSRLDWMSFVGLTLTWAGGASNLVDRLTRHGLVTDFIFIRVGALRTGIFNGADLMIMIGVVVLAASLQFRQKRRIQARLEQE